MVDSWEICFCTGTLNQNPYSPAFHLHVYGSSPQSESLEQATLEEGLRVSYKTILAKTS